MSRRFDPRLVPEAPDLSFESALWAQGLPYIAGIDEAGRGCIAGPVAAAAVILPGDPAIAAQLEGVRDSKELTPALRETWAEKIKQLAVCWGVGFASPHEIDAFNIVCAIHLAAQRALGALRHAPQHLLLDYIFLPDNPTPQTALIKGDARSLSIAAASVLAKTARDARLCAMEDEYPGYGFVRHKGYGTPGHLEALRRLGPCPIHRYSFSPVRDIYKLLGARG
jgi:ribonuclease HII